MLPELRFCLRGSSSGRQHTTPSLHVLIGETAYLIPATVPDETTKAKAVVAVMTAFSAMPDVDGVNYANVDECGSLPVGILHRRLLVDSLGNRLPAYGALAALAKTYF